MIFSLTILCAFLWAWGGASGTTRAWRWVLIPFVLALATLNPRTLLLAAPLSMGYGEDSFIRKLIKSDHLTRFILGTLYGLCLFPFVWYKPVVTAIVACLFGTVFTFEPQVKIFGKVLNTEEMIIGGTVGLMACL